MEISHGKNVLRYSYGFGSLEQLQPILNERRQRQSDYVVFFIDEYFKETPSLLRELTTNSHDDIYFVNTSHEPSTKVIDKHRDQIEDSGKGRPIVVVGVGGGSTLDTTKAVSNLLTNGGRAQEYQGWDLVRRPGTYKIGIPTISGTGAEASRTCVMTNYATGLKLGMNSDYTIFDQLLLDPRLSESVPRNQYFYTGMDSYIHCIESLNGSFRHPFSDALSEKSLDLCRKVFLNDDMMSDDNRADLMIASYFGGSAIANSYVGVVHPFSAGLSVALGFHHGLANCITMTAMGEFYPKEVDEFWEMAEGQKVVIPRGVCKDLTDEQYVQLYDSTIIHNKPLENALGEDFKSILTIDKVIDIFKDM